MTATLLIDRPLPTSSPPSSLRNFLLLRGRMRRRTFWIVQLALNASTAAVPFVLSLFQADPFARTGQLTSILLFLLAIPAIWVSIALQIRQIHDLDLRGFWLLLPIPCSFFGPFAALAATSLLALLMILDGSPGPNRFGPDPKGRPAREEEDASTLRSLARGFDRPVMVGITVGVLLLGSLPWLLGPASLLLPRALVTRIGDRNVAGVVPPYWRCPAPESERVLTALAKRLAPDLPIRIVYTTFPRITGLSLPGGRILVSQQAVRAAEQPAQMAALLAHELAHVRLRHPERRVVVSLAMTMLPHGLIGQNGPVTYGWLAPYSRAVEVAADAEAARMLARVGISPRDLGTMLTRIDAQRPPRRALAEARANPWLASHPATPERIAQIARYPAPATEVAPLTLGDWAIVQAGCEAIGP